MNIIGISAFYHESMCCLLQDGRLTAAVAEERFTRVKFDRRLPVNAFRYCLEMGGNLTPGHIDCIAYHESPPKKLARQLSMGLDASVDPSFHWVDAGRPEREIRRSLGYDGQILFFDHHHSHAAASFFYSGFKESAVMTVDGVGEWATTTYGKGDDRQVNLIDEVRFPHSLGLLYSTITDFLGFSVLSDEYKVMGLAPYGEPRFIDEIYTLIRSLDRGQFVLNMVYFDFSQTKRMFTDAMSDLFRIPQRAKESHIAQTHKDIARSLQLVLEEILLEKSRYLYDIAPSENLCLSGGVALNCVAASHLHRNGPFENLFIQPASGDAGSSLGAAALAHIKLTGRRHSYDQLPHVFWGPSYSTDAIAALLAEAAIEALDFRGKEAELFNAMVDRLDAQKVVGWFHGRMEFGPRALGARSILADPRDPTMRDHLNELVKKRESFRPFAPVILEEYLDQHMDIGHTSRFMTETCRVTSKIRLPAITHVDGSARVQTVSRHVTPRLAGLLDCFYERTDCPILVNTSFNVRGEPIVATPEDALRCMANSQIDTIVLEDFLIDKENIPASLRTAARSDRSELRDRVVQDVHPVLKGNVERWRPAEGVLPEGIYTFV